MHIAGEPLLHRVPGVHEKAGIGIQINILQAHGVEITLITMLKQRWTNVISPCVCGVIVWKRSRKTFVMWCNLSKITPENLFSWHFIKWNIQDYQICYSPKTLLHSCLRVLVKLHNICGHKILTGFCFKGASKLRKFLKKRSRRHIQDPVKCLRWIIFVKIKATWNKFRKNAPC